MLASIKDDNDIDILKHTINHNIDPHTNLEQRPVIKQLPRAKVKEKSLSETKITTNYDPP